MVPRPLLDMRWTSQGINNQQKLVLVGNKLHLQINDTIEFLQFIRDNNTLTRTSIPNHTSHRKDMKYALIKSIKNTESLTKSIQNTESDWQQYY